MISPDRQNEIVAIFQRSFKRDNTDEIESVSLSELVDADAMLGDKDLNAGYRLAMRNRIAALEKKGEQKRDSKLRALDYVMGIITGLVIAGLVKLLIGV